MSSESLVDPERLGKWLQDVSLPGDGPIESITPLPGGAQNLLFTLRRADGTELVLRRPGRHLRDDTAGAFLRESRVLTALAGTPVPHPHLYASCSDDTVIDTPFSILEKIDGFTPRGPLPGSYGTDPGWRRALAFDTSNRYRERRSAGCRPDLPIGSGINRFVEELAAGSRAGAVTSATPQPIRSRLRTAAADQHG